MQDASHSSPTEPQRARSLLDERFVTPMELAKLLGYADDEAIRKAINAGRLVAYRISDRRLLITETDALAWIESCRVEPVVASGIGSTRTRRPKAEPRRPRVVRRRDVPILGGAVVRS